MNLIPTDEYVQIIKVLPILCVDVVIQNSMGEYLLVKRANEPLKGKWWVIGGRVIKGETLEKAAIRKVMEEVGLKVNFVKPIGYYEVTFKTNPFKLSISLHSVSVVFSTVIEDGQQIKLDCQSSDWQYSNELPVDFCIKSFQPYRYAP